MPNICHNKLKIVGNKESIDEIIKSNFSFSYFIPPPLNSTTDWYAKNWCADREAFNIEFNRDWNITNPSGNQTLLVGGFQFNSVQKDTIKWKTFGKYQFEKLDLSKNFSGNRHLIHAFFALNNFIIILI